ncbi:MAG: flagellar FliJ family protein [Hyphomicrobiales bacterium]|nr:flagellar FliJ family protein [Rickettsiales bacterium]MCP5361991.1 flagellar FliJ family protein [Hyphomicrobiales bacterium]
MKGIRTLIKLAKQNLDVKRQELVQIQEKQDEYHAKNRQLENELAQEKIRARDLPPELNRFDIYLARVRDRQNSLRAAAQKLQPQIERLQGDITEAFAELKKFEILLEQKEKEEAEAEQKRETIMLDEVAIELYRRKQHEES